MTRTVKPEIFHIYGNSHYANRCPYREDSTPGKSQIRSRIPQERKPPQPRHQLIWRSGKTGGTTPNYGGLMFCQVTEITAVEQQHALSHSGSHIKSTRVLLGNQSTLDVFLNRRLLKNIRKSDRLLAIFSTGGWTTTNLQGELPGYGTV